MNSKTKNVADINSAKLIGARAPTKLVLLKKNIVKSLKKVGGKFTIYFEERQVKSANNSSGTNKWKEELQYQLYMEFDDEMSDQLTNAINFRKEEGSPGFIMVFDAHNKSGRPAMWILGKPIK
jgi:hypothetical protein